jgi:metal-responsive CopG/Arc/MetJ family transcriptional regulator
MKTAISLPDETFRRANDAAAELGVSRSELFARAVEQYLDQLAGESITSQIDALIARETGTDGANAMAAEHGAATILELTADDEW